jgi:acyl transferase domain-containing protein/acyl carrier protein
MNDTVHSQADLLQRALSALRDARQRIAAQEQQAHEPIAIVGLGCRFPGGADAQAFWQLLAQGRDAIREVPAERWDMDARYSAQRQQAGSVYARHAGLLDDIGGFDPAFFGITPREALSMDPQQRLVLETAWRALEDAGLDPAGLSGSATGVFVGATARDYAARLQERQDEIPIDAYYVSGNSLNFISGRLAYTLGLIGPSLSVDTACSSSLSAVHLAVRSLRQGECSLALAGGVNLVLAPEVSEASCRSMILAADGRCKSFDADADGIVRSEGCGMLVLMRLSDAQAQGRNVLALIRGSAINQNGASSGLMTPNPEAQAKVVRAALADAQLTPADIDYVEAHGTGTALGDPIELRALGQVFAARDGLPPVGLGSVKTNVGHLESASGLAGLVKVILALRHELIPKHLHIDTLTPHVDWQALPLRVLTQAQPWPRGTRVRRAGVSSFGGSGANAHVIVEEATVESAAADEAAPLLLLSARSENALAQLRSGWDARLAEVTTAEELAALCARAGSGRRHSEYRLAASGADAAALRQALAQARTARAPHRAPEIAFLFTGQGAQYAGMGRELYQHEAAFRAALDAIAADFEREVGAPVASVLWGEHSAQIDDTRYTQPALFALQYALCQLWQSWGVTPDLVLGHSIGEIAAACAAGVFSAADGLRIAAQRGRLMRELCEPGAMAAVNAGGERVRALLPPGAALVVAAYNAPDQCVLAGPAQALDAAVERLAAEGLTARRLSVSHAFHSPLMDPMLPAFGQACAAIRAAAPQITLVSSRTGEPCTQLDTAHWQAHVREPVAFAAAMQAVQRSGVRVVVEIGPGATLTGLARRNGYAGSAVASLAPANERAQLRRALAQLYLDGVAVDWRQVWPAKLRPYVAAPGAVFEREHYLVEGRDQLQAGRVQQRLAEWQLRQDWTDLAPADSAITGKVHLYGTPPCALPQNGELALAVFTPAADAAPEQALVDFAAALADWSQRAPGLPLRVCVAADTPAGSALRGVVVSLALQPQATAVALVEHIADAQPESIAAALRLSAATTAADPWLRVQGGRILAPRLDKGEAETLAVPAAAEGLQLISGGAGSLGLALAERCVRDGARRLLLLSRRAEAQWPAAAQARIAELRKVAEVETAAVDIADAAALQAVLDTARVRHGRIAAVWHAAAELVPAGLDNLTAGDAALQASFAAKYHGACALDRLTRADAPQTFVLVSSASALWGAPGYLAYAAANAALESLAAQRRAAGLPVSVLALGPLQESQMAQGGTGDNLESAGLSRLPLGALAQIALRLPADAGLRVLAAGDWPRFARALSGRSSVAWFSRFAAATAAPVAAAAPAAPVARLARPIRLARLAAEAAAVVAEVLKMPRAPASDEPLHALGVDSLLALEIRDRLAARYGVALAPTLIFAEPTLAAIAAHIDGLLHGAAESSTSVTASAAAAPSAGIAIVGAACRFPGGANDLESYWRNLLAGVDGITDRPTARFHVDAYLDATRQDPQRAYVMACGLMDGVEHFDAAFFGIGPREARLMDPQQRVALQTAWHALEHAGIAPQSLRGARGGVFLGVADNEYLALLNDSSGLDADLAWLGTGSKLNVIAGRISYSLDWQGPSLAVDTACSSSAVAVHLACRSLLAGESEVALAGGVNVILDPRGFAPPCRAQMLAPDGRCKTFDAAADGYVRSEGCGMLVLKRLEDAQRDGDEIIAVIRGSAVNQDGRSSSLTAPNPAAQRQVIADALAAAGLRSEDVDYVEAHGTGTALGDPIELDTLAASYAAAREPGQPLLVGAVKSQIGHAEAAAGVAGLIKLALALRHGELPPNLHYSALNPAADASVALRVVERRQPWPARDGLRHGALSAFGFSGTNAHLVLSAPPPRVDAPDAAQTAPVLCLSAATPEALQALGRQWLACLDDCAEADLPRFCALSQHGRWQGPQRIAVAASGRAAALAGLHAALAAHTPDQAAAALQFGGLDVAGEAAVQHLLGSALPAELALALRLRELGALPGVLHSNAEALAFAACAAGVLDAAQAAALHAARQSGTTLQTIHYNNAERSVRDAAGTEQAEALASAAFWQAWLRRESAFDRADAGAAASAFSTAALAAALDSAADASSADAVLRAFAWRHGADVTWPGRRVPAPAAPRYPFAATRHWPHAGTPLVPRTPARIAPGEHYLLGRKLRLPRSNEIRFQRRFEPASPAYVDDHRLLGTVVVPAASHLSMLLSAWRQIGQAGPCAVEDLRLLQPLVLHDQGARQVELILRAAADGSYAAELLSADVDSADNLDAWVTHAECQLRALSGSAAPAPVDMADLSGWSETLSAEDFYSHFWQHGYTLGSSFRWLGEGWVRAGETLRRMREPYLPDSRDAFELYPGLIDTCFSVLSSGDLDWVERQDQERIFIPVSIERLEFYGWSAPGAESFAHARAWEQNIAEGERKREDICLFEPDGRVVARIVGFETRRAQREALRSGHLESQRDWLYTQAWPARPGTPAAGRRQALVLGGDTDFGTALAQRLAAQGCALLDQAQAAAAKPAQLDIWITQTLAADGPQAVKQLLAQWQQLAQAPGSEDLRVFVLTRGACAAALGDVPQPAAAAVWGLARGLLGEHRESVLRLVDLDPSNDAAADLAACLAEAGYDAADAQVAWRGGQRLAARLQRYRPQAVHAPLAFSAGQRCVVSGGAGGIGQRLVAWLLARGAGCVQVLARRQPGEDLLRQWQELATAHKAKVEIVEADLAEAGLAQRLATHELPLEAIFHAAGSADDALALQLDAGQVQRSLAGKWLGGEALAQLAVLAGSSPRVVLFSSLAASLPGPGQAAYAAANHALDALAAQLRAQGLRAVSIGYGPWAEVGMSQRLGQAYGERLLAMGITPFAPDSGLHVMEQLMQEPVAAVAAANLRWERFLPARQDWASSSYLDAFRLPDTAAAQDDLPQRLRAATAARRADLLVDELRGMVARVLGLPDAKAIGRSQRLFDLGVDSLAAMELRDQLQRRLGVKLRATVLFDYPSLAELSQFVLQALFAEAPAAAPVTAAAATAVDTAQLDALSDTEIEAMLLAELQR